MCDRMKRGARGRGRTYSGLAVAGMSLFWLASKLGWLGPEASGVFWPVFALGLGLAVAVGGRRHSHRRRSRTARDGGGTALATCVDA